MKQFEVLISQQKISQAISRLAEEIQSAYSKDEPIIVLGLLKGSFVFMADLCRQMHQVSPRPILMDFIGASSYEGAESTGELHWYLPLRQSLNGKNILLIEDIVDTGLTLHKVLEVLHKEKPKDLKICSLLRKKSREKISIPVNFLGFDIEDKFVIGYGLDYNGRYREIPYIGIYSD
jgi:hypoxanthine phosphoribosyltransferase